MMSSHLRRQPLQDLALAPASLIAYQTAFDKFLRHSNLTLDNFMETAPQHVDLMLAAFIQHSFDEDSSFAYASHALNAVAFFRPTVKLHLHNSRQCLRGWERTRKTKSHPPLTWEMTVLIACTLSKSGFVAQAVAMLLAFDCYLRVSELTSIRKINIVLPNDARMGQADTNMAVILPRTKTGLNQSIKIQRDGVKHLLCAWLQSPSLRAAPATALVFDFTPSTLRSLMQMTCASLHLPPYVPHSLRHGGASHDFLTTGSIKHVQFRGRWKSLESSRRYIQSAQAMLAQQQIPAETHRLALQLVHDVVPFISYYIETPHAKSSRSRKRVAFAD